MRSTEFLDESKFIKGDIVLLMAGPLGRMLSSEWCLLRPEITFLDLGSFWDADLWGRKYKLDLAYPCMHRNDIDYKSVLSSV